MRTNQKNIYHYHFVESDEDKKIIKDKYYITRKDILSDNEISYSGITERINRKRKKPRMYKNITIYRVNIPVFIRSVLEPDRLGLQLNIS
jgi:hypothetical protein